jgi:hypothetical protein
MSEEIGSSENVLPNGQQQIFINQSAQLSNGVGTAGFVLALTAFALCWMPGLNFILWGIGLILSFAGVFKRPKGLAIAGLVISSISVIMIVVIPAVISSLIGSLFDSLFDSLLNSLLKFLDSLFN